jgi:hypothetical protein
MHLYFTFNYVLDDDSLQLAETHEIINCINEKYPS